jgi:nucleolin
LSPSGDYSQTLPPFNLPSGIWTFLFHFPTTAAVLQHTNFFQKSDKMGKTKEMKKEKKSNGTKVDSVKAGRVTKPVAPIVKAKEIVKAAGKKEKKSKKVKEPTPEPEPSSSESESSDSDEDSADSASSESESESETAAAPAPKLNGVNGVKKAAQETSDSEGSDSDADSDSSADSDSEVEAPKAAAPKTNGAAKKAAESDSSDSDSSDSDEEKPAKANGAKTNGVAKTNGKVRSPYPPFDSHLTNTLLGRCRF